LETSRLEKVISPHKIIGLNDGTQADIFLRDLAAINEFLLYGEGEPFIIPEKTTIVWH